MMATPPLTGEERAVFQWRYDQARGVGLTMVEAARFAEGRCDIEQMRKLAAAGCPKRLIAQIVT